ncbi:MAG: hypothetical protein U0990_12330 [Candidatus Nanopelagicales bacterium]|nr:hypothetical protein [Candidatus Nanopelagicales bacterium]MDZ4250854.1 hypothetical protein [Candidatus Nanopelagicales bacterium]
MSRSDADRLDDIATAITSIRSHLQLTVDNRLAPLADAIERMKGILPPEI